MTYNPKKAAQTIAYLILKNEGKELSALKAVKLVYLADRESVRAYGFPIQDEPRVSMPHGPVNSRTYNRISGVVEPGATGWSDFISARANNRVGISDKKSSGRRFR